MKVATEGKEELCWISSRDREQSLSLHHTHNNKRRQGGALKIRSGRKKPKLIKENREIKVMAVAVSRDLTVQVLEDVNAVKLTERQQALRTAVLRGEPKCLGVSQVMLGLMVMSYSIPLHFTEVTEVVSLGVPWWSGLTFITAGVVAIILDKHCTMKILWACLMVSVVSTVLSVVAVIIYSVDMDKNSEVPCVETLHGDCSEIHYTTMLSMGVKSSLLLFTLAQTAISAILCFLLFRHRRCYRQYASLTKAAPSTPTALIPPDLN
ncbi:transmembrane protein 176 isoform X2 [Siniperca chuatsi]|uniref:transmembrane protein 176 isoform X2 n=1 Tax=Siniperca chuatsi TaxID=119488 RepID=UPI001CE166AF|nr:transmembrane protein 176 isoform X2 [Siniperca chuatsi]